MQEGVKPRLRSLTHLMGKGQVIAAFFARVRRPIRRSGEKLGKAKISQTA